MSETPALVFGSYDYVTVALSIIVGVLASYSTLQAARQMLRVDRALRAYWLVGAALVMGIGIWSIHFIGMRALQYPLPVTYHLGLSCLSLSIAIAISYFILFFIVRRPDSGRTPGLSGLLLGSGTSAVHYLGVDAMQMPGAVTYKPELFLAAIFLTMLVSWIAVALAIRTLAVDAKRWYQPLAAVVIGVTLSGTHYIGMASIEITAYPLEAYPLTTQRHLLDGKGLIIVIALTFTLVSLFISNRIEKFRNGLSLSFITALLAVGLVMVTATTVGFVAYQHTRHVLELSELRKLTDDVQIEATELRGMVKTLKADAIFLSRLPSLNGIIRTIESGGLDPYGGSSRQVWVDQLTSTLRDFLASRPHYLQIQFVDSADDGYEIVRIERSKGRAQPAHPGELGPVSWDPFYHEVLGKKPGNVYLSNIQFRLAYSTDVNPNSLVIHAAVPIQTSEGAQFGIIIVTMDMSSIFQSFVNAGGDDDINHVADEQGRLLAFRDAAIPSLIEIGKELKLQDYYPDLANIFIPTSKQGSLTRRVEVPNGIYQFNLQKVRYNPDQPDRYIVISEALPDATLQENVRPVQYRMILVSLLLVLLGIIPALWIVRLITKPLRQITLATEEFAQGKEPGTLPKFDSGEIGILIRSFTTMTAQVKAREQSIVEKEELLRKIVNNAADGIITIDSNGIIHSMNNAASHIFGIAAAEAVSMNIEEFMPEPYRAQHARYLRRREKDGASPIIGKTRELPALRRSGEEFPLELTVTELCHGNELLFVGLLRDISQRKQAEREMRLAAKVMENALESIVVTDANACIQAVNPAFTEITGYQPSEVLGKNPSAFTSGRHDAEFYREMWRTLESTGTWQGEVWDRRKNGEIYPKWLSINAIKDEHDLVTNYVGIASDITERKSTERRMERMAHYDPLTELPNRMLFQDRLDHAMQNVRRFHTRLALLYFDLDKFKAVNDTYGHAVGDQLLVEAAARLKRCVRSIDTLARLGGDEFALIVPEITDPSNAIRVAEHVILALKEPFQLNNQKCQIGSSVGIAIFPDDTSDPDELLRFADTAMYRAKADTGNTYRLYDEQIQLETSRHLLIEGRLLEAIDEDRLELFFQPIVDMNSARATYIEALLRWNDPVLGPILPNELIPLAEKSGHISVLGGWVIDKVCSYHRRWRNQGLPVLPIAINISPRQLLNTQLLAYIFDRVKHYQLKGGDLIFELSETCLLNHKVQATQFIRKLANKGIRVSIDDFGTSHSSIADLCTLPLENLKIDQSMIDGIEHPSQQRNLVKAMINLAHDLNLPVVAEGVETREQLIFLGEQGCDMVQGICCARPVPAEGISQVLATALPIKASA